MQWFCPVLFKPMQRDHDIGVGRLEFERLFQGALSGIEVPAVTRSQTEIFLEISPENALTAPRDRLFKETLGGCLSLAFHGLVSLVSGALH